MSDDEDEERRRRIIIRQVDAVIATGTLHSDEVFALQEIKAAPLPLGLRDRLRLALIGFQANGRP